MTFFSLDNVLELVIISINGIAPLKVTIACVVFYLIVRQF